MSEALKIKIATDLQTALWPDNSFFEGAAVDTAAIDNESVTIPQDENGVVETEENPVEFPMKSNTEEDSKKSYSASILITKPTVITYNNQLLVNYDKRSAKTKKHQDALVDLAASKIMYEWHTVKSEFQRLSTGTARATKLAGATGNRKKFTDDDILWAMNTMNDRDVPTAGRRLVVDAWGYDDLRAIIKDYNDSTSASVVLGENGIIKSIHGFEIFMRSRVTRFNPATAAKKHYKAAKAATDSSGILFFHPKMVRYAKSEVKVNMDTYDVPALGGGRSMNCLLRVGATQSKESQTGVLSLIEDAA